MKAEAGGRGEKMTGTAHRRAEVLPRVSPSTGSAAVERRAWGREEKGKKRKGGSRTEGEEEHGNGTCDEDGRGGWSMLRMLLGGGEGGWSEDEGPLEDS